MKKPQLIIMVIAVIFFGLSYFITSADSVISLGVCISKTDTGCLVDMIEGVGQPLFLGSISVFLVNLVLLFLRPEVFKTWGIFALFAIPVSIGIIALTPVQSGGPIGVISIDREMATWIVSIAFLVISLLIIAIKSARLRREASVVE